MGEESGEGREGTGSAPSLLSICVNNDAVGLGEWKAEVVRPSFAYLGRPRFSPFSVSREIH